MQLTNIKRIIVEDFPKQEQETISKLGYVINNVFTQLKQILNKNITLDNLGEAIADITVQNDSNGNLAQTVQVAYPLQNKCRGISVIGVSNSTNASITPTSWPGVMFQQTDSSLLTITKVIGIQANNKYVLTIRMIGL